MSGLGTALSGFLNGYVGGQDIKHRWKDREDNKERQKRADEIRDNVDRRAEERHDMDLMTSELMNQARRQAVRSTEQHFSDEQDMRAALAAADKAANSGMGATRASEPASTPMAPSALPRQSSPPLASQVEIQKAPSGPSRAPQVNPIPTPSTQGSSSDDDDLFSVANDGKLIARAPRTPEERRRIQQAAKEGLLGISDARQRQQAAIDADAAPKTTSYTYEDWRQMSRAQRKAADLPESEIGGQLYFDRFSVGLGAEPQSKSGRAEQEYIDNNTAPSSALGRDLRTIDHAMRDLGEGVVKTGQQALEQGINTASDLADVVNAPLRKLSEYASGEDKIGEAPRVDLNKDGQAKSIVSPFVDLARPKTSSGMGAKPAAAKTKGDEEFADGAQRAMNAIGDNPDMKAAADGVPADALGATPNKPMTDDQIAKGAKTFMESWRENGAPLVVREMLKQGKISDAQALQAWVRSSEAQEGMELWAKGQFSAMMGDVDKALDLWGDAFNSAGYYDDGYQIDKAKSEILKDKSGQTVGVRVAFVDQETGETTFRNMTSDKMAETFGLILSPTEAFAASVSRQKALQDAMLEAEKGKREMAEKLILQDMKDNRADARVIFTQNAKDRENALLLGGRDGNDVPPKTMQDAKREALGQPAPAAYDEDVPIVRRPQ